MAFVKDNLMKCSINEACQMVTDLAKEYAKNEVDLFCRIMGYPKNEHNDFIGGDPHGVVAIQEDYMFFNMTDIHVVISEYERWLKIYGDNKGIRKAVEQWYYYCIDWYEQHSSEEPRWVSVNERLPERFNNKGNIQEWSVEVLSCFGGDDYAVGFYHYGTKKWYRNEYIDDKEVEVEVTHWKPIITPEQEAERSKGCPNLRSWLAGCPVDGLRDATLEWQTQRERDLQAAHQRVEECKQALEDAIKEEVKLNKF